MPIPDPFPTPAPNPSRNSDLTDAPQDRRRVSRESTGTPPHVAEKPCNPEPIAPVAPHMAETEPERRAEIVTVRSSRGKTTIVVERVPGKATHATVIDEHAQPIDSPQHLPQQPIRRRRRRRRRAKS